MRQLSQAFGIILSVFMLMTMAKTGFAEIINHEEAIETNEIMIVGNQSSGYVLAKKCDTCPQLRLPLSPNTKAYHKNRQVPISSVPGQSKIAITVIYDVKTNIVNRIMWW